MLAELMKIPCYYKEVTALAAQESGLATEFISDINKDSPNVLKELRAADYVLRDYPHVLRVFIYAPKNYRVKKVMEMYGDTMEEAKRNIEHSDKARAAYYHSITGKMWAQPENYDLCIDSSIGEKACAEVVFEYLKRKSS